MTNVSVVSSGVFAKKVPRRSETEILQMSSKFDKPIPRKATRANYRQKKRKDSDLLFNFGGNK